MTAPLNSDQTVWTCKVGCVGPLEIPEGGDAPMRDSIERAYKRTIGVEPEFCFSGWGSGLTEPELAVVEDRLPDHSKVTREIPYDVTDAMIERAADAIERVGWGWRLDTDHGLKMAARAALRAALDDKESTDGAV